jgi:hypothetical protein
MISKVSRQRASVKIISAADGISDHDRDGLAFVEFSAIRRKGVRSAAGGSYCEAKSKARRRPTIFHDVSPRRFF